MVTAARIARLAVPVIGLLVFLLTSCTPPQPSPRDRVLEFVRLIQSDSLPNIQPYIDLDSVATYEYAAPKFDSLSLAQKKQRLALGFQGDGEYRRTWAASQIVVNEEQFLDDTTATVEVSFIDRSTRIQYYSQFLMKLRPIGWIATSFKVN